MTEIELRLEYTKRTWSFELPDAIEQVLENDYVVNSNLYTDQIIKMIQVLYVLKPDVTPSEMVDWVHFQAQSNV